MPDNDPSLILASLASKPYSVDNTLAAYKAIHEVLGLTYVSAVDFSSYAGSIDPYVKTPLHIVVDACMSQVEGLTHAVLAAIGASSKPKSDLDLDMFIDTVSGLSKVAIIRYLDNPYPVDYSVELDSKAEASLSDSDKALCRLYNAEMTTLITLAGTMVNFIYPSENISMFRSLSTQWTKSLFDVFVSTISVKNRQTGGR